MNMNQDKEHSELNALIVKAQEGSLSDEERSLLNDLMRSPGTQKLYFEIIKVNCALHHLESGAFERTNAAEADSDYHTNMLEQLAEHEKTAPEIILPEEEPQRQLIPKVLYPPREKRKMSKFGTAFLIMNAAALLFFLLFLKLAPPTSGVKVATLTDSLNAKWAGAEGRLVNGASIAAGSESLLLSEGYAEFLFNNQTKVTLEGPAEFQMVAEDQVKLVYGRLYARVPREAIGFTVKTPSAQIVDLGTEFGIECDLRSNTSLHVTKGKTVLIAGDKSNKVSVEVKEGIAKRVSATTRTVSDIACQDRLFVREISSAGQSIWRGETAISLADIIGGGSGFGTVRSLIGLDPVTGHYTSAIDRTARGSKDGYRPVPDCSLIDGVFVPDGGTVITSSGDTFSCPDTDGLVSHAITVYTGNIETRQETIPPAIFNGRLYEQEAVVMIHSNAGITFDLQAIRRSLPGLEVTSFEAFGGLSEALNSVKTRLPDVGFWVLVDGQIRYEKNALKLDSGAVSFDVELAPQDRFLTLIVTDGASPTDADQRYAAWNNDFFYLIDPTLRIAKMPD